MKAILPRDPQLPALLDSGIGYLRLGQRVSDDVKPVPGAVKGVPRYCYRALEVQNFRLHAPPGEATPRRCKGSVKRHCAARDAAHCEDLRL